MTAQDPEASKTPASFKAVLLLLGGAMLAAVLYTLATSEPRAFPPEPVLYVVSGDPRLGRESIRRHGCGACHVIPGIPAAEGRVGPQLSRFREQIFIAGHLPNTPDNLIRWIQDPQAVAPGTAMPKLGISEQDARDIASYLYQLR